MRQIDRAYAEALESLRRKTAEEATRRLREIIQPDDIAATYRAFVPEAVPLIEAAQQSAQELATSYLSSLGGRVIPEDDGIAGTTRVGSPIRAGMEMFGSMILGSIGNGHEVAEALEFGYSLVSGFIDREVTAAHDRETERQVEADRAQWEWEGIVQPGSCDACAANAGRHSADEEFYRHNDCACTRVWVRAGSEVATDGETDREPAGVDPYEDQEPGPRASSLGDPRWEQTDLIESGQEPALWGSGYYESYYRDLDRQTRAALDGYTQESYSQINASLRQGGLSDLTPEELRTASRVEVAIEGAPRVPDDVTVYRGLGSGSEITSLSPGDEFIDAAFISTSLEREHAEKFAGEALAELRVPEGSKALYMLGSSIAESELVLGRDSVFQMVGRRPDGTIVLELVRQL